MVVNESDTQGGAARAAHRLHLSLLSAGIDSRMLVQRKFSDDPTVLGPETDFKRRFGKVRPFLDLLPAKKYKDRTNALFSTGWLPFGGVAERINQLNPDLVHLHWITGGMMRIEEIVKIEAPIIWTLHDNWAFTGGCHIMRDCRKHALGCGGCPVLGSDDSNDLSWKVFRRKEKAYHSMKNCTLVGLSRWIAEEAERSRLFAGKKVVCLPNPIDTDDYRPINKETAREILRLPKGKKIVAFGALDALSDPNKGYNFLLEGLNNLRGNDTELVVFGASQPGELQTLPFKTSFLGRLHDDVTLCLVYNACDALVVPSLQENLSNSILEALSCGTPVVAFNVGGNSDMIQHYKNGYLAIPFEVYDLAKGIDWVLNAPNYEELKNKAREKVLCEFRSEIVAEKYVQLYKQTIECERR